MLIMKIIKLSKKPVNTKTKGNHMLQFEDSLFYMYKCLDVPKLWTKLITILPIRCKLTCNNFFHYQCRHLKQSLFCHQTIIMLYFIYE